MSPLQPEMESPGSAHDSAQARWRALFGPRSGTPLQRGGILLAVAVLYFLTARFGLLFAIPGGHVTPVWPPSGLALAAMLIFGRSLWPGIWLGSFAANLWGFLHAPGEVSVAAAIVVAVGIGAGGAATAWVGAELLRRFVGEGNSIERARDVCAFMGLGGVIACLLGATNGVLWLGLGGFAPWSAYGSIWLTWWLGDTAGVFVFAPLLLAWCVPPSFPRRTRWVEAGACFALLLAAGHSVFIGHPAQAFSGKPFAFVIIPFLVWPALRFGQRGAATAAFAIACLAVWGTIHRLGPFDLPTLNESLLVLELFLSVVSLTALCIAAVTVEQSHAEAERQRVLDELESHVRGRTAALVAEIAERQHQETLLSGQKQVLEMIAAAAPLSETLATLLRVLEAQSPEMLCSLLLLDPDGTHLRHGAAPSLPEAYTRAIDGLAIGASVGSCGTAAFRREAVFVADIANDPLWADYRGLALEHGLRACWSTPIFDAQKKMLGTFAIYYRQPGPPTEQHLRLLDIATQTAAIAISRQQAEAALREKEQFLSESQRIAHIGGWYWDLAGPITWTEETYRVYGVAPETFTLTAETFFNLIHPADRPAMQRWVAACAVGEKPGELEFRALPPDGSARVLSGRGELMSGGGNKPAVMAGTVQDITERKQAEEALREAEARLRLSVAASNIGLWDWNLVTNDVYFSPEWKSQLGCTDDEISNRFEEWETRLHPDDLAPTVAKVRAFIEDPDAHYEVEFRMRHKDGSYRWIFTQAQIFRDAAGKAARMVGCHIDITERKRAEDALRAFSRRLLQAEDEERRRIAKELHDSTAQDLVAVMLNLGMLRDTLPPIDGQPAQVIEDSIALIENSANDIRTLSYLLHPPRLEETGLPGGLAEYAAGLGKRADIRIRVEAAADFGRLPEGLELVLFRVAQESLSNVVRHSESDAATVRLTREGGSAVLEIEDYGRGMPPGDTLPPGARGVGIAGMRERLQHFGGRLEIESGSRGTTVRAVVPL